MLKNPDSMLSLQQQQQQQEQQEQQQKQQQTTRCHSQHQSHASKHAKDNKNPGNSLNLLKATSKVLAFLNPSGRKSSSTSAADQYDRTQNCAQVDPTLFFLQANTSVRRGPIHESLGDTAVEQYKHLFQNRPLNNTSLPQPQPKPQPQVISSQDSHPKSQTKSSVRSRSNIQNKGHPSEVEYTESEKQLAKKRLCIVRKNLRDCPSDSAYFREFSGLVDDWRNFLPNTNSNRFNYSKASRSNVESGVDSQDEHAIDGDVCEEDDEYDEYDGEEEEEEDECEEGYYNASRRTASSASTSSFVKELLREQELSKLVSSASVANIADVDDVEEAAFADADEYSPNEVAQREKNSGSRRSTSGPVARGVRKLRQRANRKDTENEAIEENTYRSSRSNHRRSRGANNRVRSNEVTNLGVRHGSQGGRHNYSHRRSTGRKSTYHQYASQFGGVKLEDVIRGIESEFSLYFNSESLDSDSESEDSLTCLIPGRGNSEEESPESTSTRRSIASSQAESMVSTGSTLLNSGRDSISDFSENILESSQEFHHESSEKKQSQNQQEIRSASTAALAEAMASTAENEQKEKVKRNRKSTEGRPNLKLQTAIQNMAGIAPGALSAFEKRPAGSQFSLTKCNSTSSLYIDSTMSKSDVDETLRAVAKVLYDKVLHSHRINDCRTERIVNSSSYVPSEKVMMTQSDIFEFMRFIFDCGQNLGAENAIITLIYVERMTELGNLSFHAINWRRILLGALILSIKVWEDLAVFNSDVCAIFEGLSVKDVNALERFTMGKLQYNVSVKRSIYATYYFRLRDVSEQQYNQRYGKLTLSMSQRDMMLQGGVSSQSLGIQGNCSASGSASSQGSGRSGSSGGLMAMGINGNISSILSGTHHTKVPIGPGYRKWTLKPLSVREADRLEARSSLFASTMMMEQQERKDAGCYWDEYSTATPEELHNLSATLLSSSSSVSTTTTTIIESQGNGEENKIISTSTSISTVTSTSGSINDLASSASEDNAKQSAENTQSNEPPRKTLRLKKSRSDFFFQNSTPASIM